MVTIRRIMTSSVKTVTPETSLKELAELLSEQEVSGVPVVAAGRVVGVVSATDLLEFDSEERDVPTFRAAGGTGAEPFESEDDWAEKEGDPPAAYFADMWVDAGADVVTRISTERPEWNALDDHVVSEVMTRQLLAVAPDADVREAARRMIIGGVHRLLVMEDGQLAGVVTTSDLVEAIASYGLGS